MFDRVLYWRLNKAHNCLITRDDKWFAENINTISEFWDRVLELRKDADQLKTFVDKTTRKPKLDENGDVIKRKPKYPVSEDGSCFIDEDDPYTDAVPSNKNKQNKSESVSAQSAAPKRIYAKKTATPVSSIDEGCFVDD